MRLQSGTILTVEQVEDEFECPECWKHPINNATCFKHCIEFAYSIFSFRKIGHLPQGPAAGQTGDVASAGSGVTGALAAPSDEAPAETPRRKFQKTKSQCNGGENSKALQTERSRICSGALYVGGIDDENDINTDSEAMVQQENFKGTFQRCKARSGSDENFVNKDSIGKSKISGYSSPESTKICMNKIPHQQISGLFSSRATKILMSNNSHQIIMIIMMMYTCLMAMHVVNTIEVCTLAEEKDLKLQLPRHRRPS